MPDDLQVLKKNGGGEVEPGDIIEPGGVEEIEFPDSEAEVITPEEITFEDSESEEITAKETFDDIQQQKLSMASAAEARANADALKGTGALLGMGAVQKIGAILSKYNPATIAYTVFSGYMQSYMAEIAARCAADPPRDDAHLITTLGGPHAATMAVTPIMTDEAQLQAFAATTIHAAHAIEVSLATIERLRGALVRARGGNRVAGDQAKQQLAALATNAQACADQLSALATTSAQIQPLVAYLAATGSALAAGITPSQLADTVLQTWQTSQQQFSQMFGATSSDLAIIGAAVTRFAAQIRSSRDVNFKAFASAPIATPGGSSAAAAASAAFGRIAASSAAPARISKPKPIPVGPVGPGQPPGGGTVKPPAEPAPSSGRPAPLGSGGRPARQ